jgi:hypothetical protein
VKVIDVTDVPGGRRGTLVLTPRDRYDNPLGPGRGDTFTVSPLPGVVIDGEVEDRGDGSYGVGVVWDVSVTADPGVVVQQPDRDPAPVTPPARVPPCSDDCTDAAGDLLTCLGLHHPDVRRVRITNVKVELDLDDPKCEEDSDC